MPRRKPNYDFDIHIDPSCLGSPMEEETGAHLGAIDSVEEAASTPQEPPVDPAEPHADESTHDTDNDAADLSMMSDDQSVEQDNAETIDAEEEEGTGTDLAENSIMSHDDDSQALQDTSYAADSTVDEEEATHGEDEERYPTEHSILPSIESEAGDYTQEISVLDDSLLEDDRSSHRGSSRRDSGRTAALIQQAARDILAEIEAQRTEQHHEQPEDESILSSYPDASEGQYDLSGSSMTEQQRESHLEEALAEASQLVEPQAEEPETERSMVGELQPEEQEAQHIADEGGESSSQHGTDEDIFSEKSARSSLGSYDGGSESGKRNMMKDTISAANRTPRVSDISQYDPKDDGFIPTIRGAPRPPFRSPSDVRAMQMSSPPASVFGSVVVSPRSSRRHFPSVSRLGSPAPSAQYSPKNRTPSRFKAKEAPLVLLHVTLLPLRWVWGNVINSFDASDMSEEAKSLRESWRMLQDRMGDTVVERGILLGHPQNDYEMLEERLLEALDLPMRRRARILECGHYLGPANEDTIVDDSDSEDEYDMVRPAMKRHWCGTCQNEIRYDSLGPGKIFRVKVYASNGLMKAGAWDACWKEMERVDIELEPFIEPGVNEELARLAAAQQEREVAASQQIELAADVIQQIEEQVEEQMNQSLEEQPDLLHAQMEITPPYPEPRADRSSFEEDRQRQDEERLREIYGGTPNPETAPRAHDAAAHQRHPDSYIPPPSPRSPSVEAYERRQARRQSLQSASFFELLTQSARVLMQDTRNIFIVGLSFMVLLMAIRSPNQNPPDTIVFEDKSVPQVSRAPVMEAPVTVREQAPVVESMVSYSVAMQSVATQSVVVQESVAPVHNVEIQDAYVPSSATQQAQTVLAIEPEVTSSASQEAVIQKTTVRVVETVTETETFKVETVTETETMKVKATVTVSESSEAPQPTAQEPEPSTDSEELKYASEASESTVSEQDAFADSEDSAGALVAPDLTGDLLVDDIPVVEPSAQMDDAPVVEAGAGEDVLPVVESSEQADDDPVVEADAEEDVLPVVESSEQVDDAPVSEADAEVDAEVDDVPAVDPIVLADDVPVVEADEPVEELIFVGDSAQSNETPILDADAEVTNDAEFPEEL